MYVEPVSIKVLEGKIPVEITINDGNDEIFFRCSDGSAYKMYHSQDCCESVNIEEVFGDLKDLLGSPILAASEEESDKNPEGVETDCPSYNSFTWTFYV